MGLQNSAVFGVIWSVGQELASKLIGFFITVILARILSPAEFGLIAMLSIFIAIGNSLLDGGLTSSLIRTNIVDQKDCSTVFYFNLIGSVLVYLLLFSIAPLISGFYNQPVLKNVVRVYGLSLIINSFFGIQQTLLVKEMRFKLMTVIQIPAALGGGVIGVILAKLGFGVWSLVWMSLLNAVISTFLHWWFSAWRPAFLFDYISFKKHFNYGYKLTLSGLLDKLYQNIYTIIIGKFYAPAQLGLYARADSTSQLPINIISSAINKVTFPLFVKVEHDNEQLVKIYRRVMLQVLFWMTPALVWLCVVAEPLFRSMLGEKWVPSAPYFQILCIAGIMYPLSAYNLNVLKVKGKSDLFLKLEVVKKILSVVGILCVFPFGIYGLLYLQLFFSFFSFFINSIYSARLINYPAGEQIKDVLPTLLLAAALGITCYFLDIQFHLSFHFSDLLRITTIAFIYITSYFGLALTIKLSAIIDFKQLILKR